MAIGDIGATVIDTITLRNTGLQPSICRVSGSVYAVAYTDTVGIVTTFSLDSSGNFSAAVDSLTFEGSSCGGPTIIRAHDGIFAVAYSGVDSDGFCKTFDIDSSGNIGAVIDTLEFETANCTGRAQNFLPISGDIFAFAYQGGATSTHLSVKTFDIDSSGNIGAVVDTLTIAVGGNKGVSFIHCTGSLYATLINQSGNDTQLDTFTISDAGSFSAVINSVAVDDPGNGTACRMFPIGGDNYVLSYYELTWRLATRSISPAGVIGAEIDLINLSGSPYTILGIGDGVYAYARLLSGVASVHTIAIAADGTIGSEVDNLEISASSSQFPHIIYHQSDIYAVALTGPPTNDGLVKTLDIESGSLVVTTQTCEDVVDTTATGRGNITDLGGGNVTAHGHCWATTVDPTTSDSSVDNGAASATGAFTSAITGLTPGTAYYTRAYATNSATPSYGANVYFVASSGRAGYIWMEGSNLRGFDENAVERKYIHTDDVDDTPVDAATTDPISSNWAYDHENSSNPHPIVTYEDTVVTHDGQVVYT